MANIHDLFPSRFIKTSDLQGKEPTVRIARVELETVGHVKRETKLVVYFAGKSKGLKLNKTLATAIAAIAGSPMTEAWIGVTLCLYAASATFGHEAFPVVRVKAAAAAPRLVPSPAPQPLKAPPAAVSAPPAPAAAGPQPKGYVVWFAKLRAAAMAGTASLTAAWLQSSSEYRLHMATVAPNALDELKVIAGRVAGAGTRAS